MQAHCRGTFEKRLEKRQVTLSADILAVVKVVLY